MPGRRIDRATADDMVSLATDVAAVPMQVGAVLFLDTPDGFDDRRAVSTMGDRIESVPRLRQRLVRTPVGCGRPVWVDDVEFDLDQHVEVTPCPSPGDHQAVLDLAADVIATRLPADRPLWSVRFVTGVDAGRTAMIVTFHHVLADGIGGLAVLGALVDGAPASEDPGFPRAAPSTIGLLAESVRTRVLAVTRLRTGLGRLRDATAQLRQERGSGAQRCSLQHPTGPRRRLVVVRADLAAVLSAAHRHEVTVNDVVLTAVAAALRSLLGTRGESVDRFVISVPVSARQRTDVDELGNQVGVVRIEVPATGDPRDRLSSVARRTAAAKASPRAASTALLGPVFRVLARLGLFTWFIDRQHLVHTFVTNLRGPDVQLSFIGAAITDVVAVANTTGNVSVSFAVMSYAGTLNITVIADPDACPDLAVLHRALRAQLDDLIDHTPSPGDGAAPPSA